MFCFHPELYPKDEGEQQGNKEEENKGKEGLNPKGKAVIEGPKEDREKRWNKQNKRGVVLTLW